jgi:hypothetical protein
MGKIQRQKILLQMHISHKTFYIFVKNKHITKI